MIFELCKNGQAVPSFDQAVQEAIRVVHSYQYTGWNRIPEKDNLPEVGCNAFKVVTSRRFGTPFLPSNGIIDLAQAATCIPGFYSVTLKLVETLNALLEEAECGNKSIVLVASGGSGKTQIAEQIQITTKQKGLYSCSFKDLKINWDWSKPTALINKISAACSKISEYRPFIVVDEALKLKGNHLVEKEGVLLLNDAEDAKIRFLFIDADFAKRDFDQLKSQFLRRVIVFNLPSAWGRPHDIPYVFASCLRKSIGGRVAKISIETSALISVIEWLLDNKLSFGDLSRLSDDIMTNQIHADEISIRWGHLPEKIKGKYRPRGEMYAQKFIIKYD